MPANARTTLGAVVVAWRNADEIGPCLASLSRAASFAGVGLHTVVVDNASRDATADIIRSSFPDVELIENRKNRLYTAATNQALARLDSDLVLLLNPDVQLERKTLASLLTALGSDPDLAAVAPQLILPDGTIERLCRTIPTYATVFFEATGLARVFPRMSRWKYPGFDHMTSRDVDQPMALCLLLRMDAFDRAGRRLDERLPLYFSDVELALRLRRSGFRLRFVAEARARHLHGASTRRSRVRSAMEHSRSFVRFLWDAFPGRRLNMIWAAPLLFLVGLVRAGVRSLD